MPQPAGPGVVTPAPLPAPDPTPAAVPARETAPQSSGTRQLPPEAEALSQSLERQRDFAVQRARRAADKTALRAAQQQPKATAPIPIEAAAYQKAVAQQLEHEFARRENKRSKAGAPASLWEAVRKLGLTVTLDQLLPCLAPGTEEDKARWGHLAAFLRGDARDTIDPPVAVGVCRLLPPKKVPGYLEALKECWEDGHSIVTAAKSAVVQPPAPITPKAQPPPQVLRQVSDRAARAAKPKPAVIDTVAAKRAKEVTAVILHAGKALMVPARRDANGKWEDTPVWFPWRAKGPRDSPTEVARAIAGGLLGSAAIRQSHIELEGTHGRAPMTTAVYRITFPEVGKHVTPQLHPSAKQAQWIPTGDFWTARKELKAGVPAAKATVSIASTFVSEVLGDALEAPRGVTMDRMPPNSARPRRNTFSGGPPAGYPRPLLSWGRSVERRGPRPSQSVREKGKFKAIPATVWDETDGPAISQHLSVAHPNAALSRRGQMAAERHARAASKHAPAAKDSSPPIGMGPQSYRPTDRLAGTIRLGAVPTEGAEMTHGAPDGYRVTVELANSNRGLRIPVAAADLLGMEAASPFRTLPVSQSEGRRVEFRLVRAYANTGKDQHAAFVVAADLTALPTPDLNIRLPAELPKPAAADLPAAVQGLPAELQQMAVSVSRAAMSAGHKISPQALQHSCMATRGPDISVHLLGQPLTAGADTKADVTIMDTTEYLQNHHKRLSEAGHHLQVPVNSLGLQGFSGTTTVPLFGVVPDAPISINGVETHDTIFVMPCNHPFLLGATLLSKYDAVIDFGSGTLDVTGRDSAGNPAKGGACFQTQAVAITMLCTTQA